MQKLVAISLVVSLTIGLAACDQSDKMVVVTGQKDPNGTSELQVTMRVMYDHFAEIKQAIQAGRDIAEVEVFEQILTDKPTESGKNRTEIYREMADNYIKAARQLQDKQDATSYEQVVMTCMLCHKQVCPGPMVKIKQLYLQ